MCKVYVHIFTFTRHSNTDLCRNRSRTYVRNGNWLFDVCAMFRWLWLWAHLLFYRSNINYIRIRGTHVNGSSFSNLSLPLARFVSSADWRAVTHTLASAQNDRRYLCFFFIWRWVFLRLGFLTHEHTIHAICYSFSFLLLLFGILVATNEKM